MQHEGQIGDPSSSTLTHSLAVDVGAGDSTRYWASLLARFKRILEESVSVPPPTGTGEEEDINATFAELQFESALDLADPWEGLDQEHSEPDIFGREWFIKDTVTEVLAVLCSRRSDEQIQDSLIQLIGYDNLELLTRFLTNRRKIVQKMISSTRNLKTSRKPSGVRACMGSPVLVRDLRRSEGDSTGLNTVQAAAYLWGSKECEFAESGKNSEDSVALFQHVYLTGNRRKEDIIRGRVLDPSGRKLALPEASERIVWPDYEEIVVPKGQKFQFDESKRISIVTLDAEEWVKGCFQGYEHLNAMQSLVFPTAFRTNENLLVCAPTGAGKTDVAMLTILRCISEHVRPSDEPGMRVPLIAYDEFKIVYVAPMKALAAEVVGKFSSRLGWLGIQVRECTGDMQLTKAQIMGTQMIVTTPEKWDVLTRKPSAGNDLDFIGKVKLLIIDEVHLLHDDRGAVLETIVARTQRQVEMSQRLVRFVGLSATLPNFVDVGGFLRVSPSQGLFYFDSGFRPVPLQQHFVGVKGKPGTADYSTKLNRLCYDRVVDLVAKNHQVLVFVHSRNDTLRTLQAFENYMNADGSSALFRNWDQARQTLFDKDLEKKTRHKDLKRMVQLGLGMHHAGMIRSDRKLVERWFLDGTIRVLTCTATLAWGVNLPAYAVLIKGTSVFDAQKGDFTDLSVLDVFQIFGRAGRPQYEDAGVAHILTSHEKLAHYVGSMMRQYPIESRFAENLPDHLNAEIALGTVHTVEEAIRWLGYTYLFVRMKKNPLNYAIEWKNLQHDHALVQARRKFIESAIKTLIENQMIIYDVNTESLGSKDLGSIASSFYIKHDSIRLFNQRLSLNMTEADLFAMVSECSEFSNLKYRQEEDRELKRLQRNFCPCEIKGGAATDHGKVNVLIQTYISRGVPEAFALISDSNYLSQNMTRVFRALFEICLKRGWGPTMTMILSVCKSVERRVWSFEHPLVQFDLDPTLSAKIQDHLKDFDIPDIRKMSSKEIGRLVRHSVAGPLVKQHAAAFPMVDLEASIAPITSRVLRMELRLHVAFHWSDRYHGYSQNFWVFVEDSDTSDVYHSEKIRIEKRGRKDTMELSFVIPLPELAPKQLYIRVISDTWMGSEVVVPLSFKHLILPDHEPRHTELQDLRPLSVAALENHTYERIMRKRFDYFNAIQTQCFHTLYHSDTNVLLGAPTGSGKTVAAELAIWRAFGTQPDKKVVYIAPLKALVRERVEDWTEQMARTLGKTIVELTGDKTPDSKTLEQAHLIITTPEKWDGISRSWQSRGYVQSVSLVIIDEIHLLGGDRGPVLEVIVSRLNFVSHFTKSRVRVVGLSTALANAGDLAKWLSVPPPALYNFKHSVRPVPLQIHIDGFPGKHYCPRMASMNKPAYGAILQHSPSKPVLIFVSSRRQTRLTAQDLISHCAMSGKHDRFLNMTNEELEPILTQVRDRALRHSVAFGIGLHHAGLANRDRKIAEELFVNQRIQVLIATSTLAWGINTPAHLVIIKGTEYYDADTKGYVNYPLTDVLQMMGRAGRPQFDDQGVACIYVQDVKKEFYKRFLHSPFPVESALHKSLDDHLNAEIAFGSIKSKQDAIEYMTWTYLYHRLRLNPTYYGLLDNREATVGKYLSQLISSVAANLIDSGCIQVDDEDQTIVTTQPGRLAAYYYLSHRTMRLFGLDLHADADYESLMETLSSAPEFDELPVRHNEDLLNQRLAEELPLRPIARNDWLSPHVKTQLLIQSHFSRITEAIPISDYITDTNSVLDQAVRVLQCMIDFAVNSGHLVVCLKLIHLLQCIKQARWPDDDPLLQLPHLCESMLTYPVAVSLPEILQMTPPRVRTLVSNIKGLDEVQRQEIYDVLAGLPLYCLDIIQPEKLPLSSWVRGRRVSVAPMKSDDPGLFTYKLVLRVRRLDALQFPKGGRSLAGPLRIHAPHFPKTQKESLILVLGAQTRKSPIAIKRVTFDRDGKAVRNLVTAITFSAAPELGVRIWLYACVDGYLGLDQEYSLVLDLLDGGCLEDDDFTE